MMKRIISSLIALVMALSFASCAQKKDGYDAKATLQAMFDGLKANESYAEFKSMYTNTNFKETLEDAAIRISMSGTDDLEGNYEYKVDGDYLTYTYRPDGQYAGFGASLLIYLREALCDYYGMDPSLVNGYVNGCEYFDTQSKYLIREENKDAGTVTLKMYIAGKYDMKEIDDMYINEKSLEFNSELDDYSSSGVVSVGKITMIYSGSKDSVTVLFREYGKRSELTYKSVMSTVAKFKPNGYETFAAEYTGLKEVKGNGYTVTFGVDEELKENYNLDSDGYEFTVVKFG